MDAPLPLKPARRDGLTGYLASGFAVLLSLISLSVAFSSNRTQERLLAASVWPALEYATGNRGDDGSDTITLSIGNSGVGPARLRSIQLVYQGEPAANIGKLLFRCCGLGEQPARTITSGLRARVLKAGDDVTFMLLPREGNVPEVWDRFNNERFQVQLRACYCSVLDDCWMLDSAREEPEPVAGCPALPDEVQWHG